MISPEVFLYWFYHKSNNDDPVAAALLLLESVGSGHTSLELFMIVQSLWILIEIDVIVFKTFYFLHKCEAMNS